VGFTLICLIGFIFVQNDKKECKRLNETGHFFRYGV